MDASGFGSKVVLTLTGVTYRQLDYWARTGLTGSSIREAAGRGSRRVYSFADLLALRVVARLLAAGVSLQAVRRALKYLKRHTQRPLSTLGLVARGKRIFVLTEDPARMLEATADGQVVIAIALEPIARELKAEVVKISAPRAVEITVGGRRYQIVLTPDLEAGGFTVHVPGLSGCLTEGETVAEAKSMAREAIDAWHEAAMVSAPRHRVRA